MDSAADGIDHNALEQKALRHVARYETTAARLTLVLRRHAARTGGTPSEELERWIGEIIAKLRAKGLVDDRRYAALRSRVLKQRGSARSLIRQDLAARGVNAADAVAAIDSAEAEIGGDLEAAWAYARRRRLGPFRRDPGMRADSRLKDMAALARRGFGPDIARRVIDGDPD